MLDLKKNPLFRAIEFEGGFNHGEKGPTFEASQEVRNYIFEEKSMEEV